jgi:hypothetical protein
MENNFCVFIISNGRPNNIKTLGALTRAGFSLPLYIIIDNEDKTGSQYREIYKDSVIVFNKREYAEAVDNFDNTENYRSTTHARNACFDIAENLGYKYFLVLDDDYGGFKFRINGSLSHPDSCPNIKSGIDEVFMLTLEYYKSCPFLSICFSQGGDWFSGHNNFNKKPKRKAMNSFFCSTERRFKFISRLNEDVNTYMALGATGNVFMTIPFIQLDQAQTQSSKGGMTEAYQANGTYVKSFYTVMCRPDCAKVSYMGETNKRFHHLISWGKAVPCIIHEKYRKND